MNRFDLLKVFVLGTALAAGGCFANASEDTGTSGDELRHAQYVGVGAGDTDQAGGASNKMPTLVNPTPTETTFVIGGGPSPDPWHGDQQSGDPNGPSPDPWHPRAHLTSAPTTSNGSSK